MVYEVDVTVTVTIRKPGMSPLKGRTGATMSQTVTRTSGAPSERVRAVQERRRSNAAGVHVTRQTRAAMLAQALAEDPLEGLRWRRHITAVEEAPCTVDASCEEGCHSYTWPCDYAPGTGRLRENK